MRAEIAQEIGRAGREVVAVGGVQLAGKILDTEDRQDGRAAWRERRRAVVVKRIRSGSLRGGRVRWASFTATRRHEAWRRQVDSHAR